jgi:class 3 adenylate cyclase
MPLSADLDSFVATVLEQKWNVREQAALPAAAALARGSAVSLDVTILASDLQQAQVETDLQLQAAARVVRAFLGVWARLVPEHGGAVTGYAADRMLAIFLGDRKNSRATRCALKMNHVLRYTIEPQIGDYFKAHEHPPFRLSHCAGIETGAVLGVRAADGASDDIVWAGAGPSVAIELSRLHGDYLTYITAEVYERLNHDAKDADDPEQDIWQEHTWDYLGRPMTIFGSDWTWQP